MDIHHAARLAVVVASLTIAAATDARAQQNFAGPTISSVTPAAPTRSDAAQVLTVNGTNFSAALSVTLLTPDGRRLHYGGAAIQARQETSFRVTVKLAVSGAYSLTVQNPDGAASEPFVIKGQPSLGTPRIERVLPEQLTTDSQPQALTVSGVRFAPGLSVYLTNPIGTVYLFKSPAVGAVTPTSFEVSVVLEMDGEYSLMVTSLSGESSNTVALKVAKRASVLCTTEQTTPGAPVTIARSPRSPLPRQR